MFSSVIGGSVVCLTGTVLPGWENVPMARSRSPRSSSKRYPDPEVMLAKVEAKRKRTLESSIRDRNPTPRPARRPLSLPSVVAGAKADLEASKATRRRVAREMAIQPRRHTRR